ncbi:MAG: class I SAM-dependent methyltransferase [Rhizobacter sp.]|nr:class I SAM-dependent methyltransferase [Burkholderiales bacterium]
MSLTFTGERFLPECAGEMVYEHWHRYLIAQQYVRGLRVLDVASGEGYGSHLLARDAAAVVGVDLSADAVLHAASRYPAANLKYIAASCIQIPQPDASFDVIVSFETIEHIMEHEAFLREVDRLLAPGGMFIISSPNRVEYSDRTGYKNEFHVKELDRAELKTLLDPFFPAQQWFAQRAAFHSMVWPVDAVANSAVALTADGESGFPAEVYFLVFCAREATRLAAVESQLSLVTDRELSVYSEWSRTYRDNAAMQAEIKALKADAAARASLPHVLVTAPAETSAPAPLRDATLVRWAKKLTGSH